MTKKTITLSIAIVLLGVLISYSIINTNKPSQDEPIPEDNLLDPEISKDKVLIYRDSYWGINTPYWTSSYYHDESTGKMYYMLDTESGSPELGIEMKNADPSTFTLLNFEQFTKSTSFAVDKNGIWCNYQLKEEIDPKSFFIFGETHYNTRAEKIYSKDKNHLYRNCEIINDYDKETFSLIHPKYTRDKNGVYYNDKLITSTQGEGLIVTDDYYLIENDSKLYSLSTQKQIGDTPYLFNKNSSGSIKLVSPTFQIKSDGTISTELNDRIIAIFVSSTTPGTASIIPSLSLLSGSKYYTNLLVYKNKLYSSNDRGNNSGSIGIFDFSNNQIDQIDLLSNPNVNHFDDNLKIVDFTIDNNLMFVLVGTKNCKEYLAQCTTDLYQYDLDTKSIKKIYSGLHEDGVIGLDEEKTSIATVKSFGDAGAWSNRYEIINLTDFSKTEYMFSGYSGEGSDDSSPTNDEEYAKSNAIHKKYSSNYIIGAGLNIREGKIVIPNETNYLYPIVKYIFK